MPLVGLDQKVVFQKLVYQKVLNQNISMKRLRFLVRYNLKSCQANFVLKRTVSWMLLYYFFFIKKKTEMDATHSHGQP